MIELSVTELFLLTLTFFVFILGTLAALALVRVLRILKAADDAVSYYWDAKNMVANVSQIPAVALERIQSNLFTKSDETSQTSKKDKKKKTT